MNNNNNLRQYPLYDELLRRVKARNDKEIDIGRMCTTINNISLNLPSDESNEHYNEIGALILHYHLLYNNGVIVSSTPYDGKLLFGGRGVVYDPKILPPLLQHIIAQYVENPNLEKSI